MQSLSIKSFFRHHWPLILAFFIPFLIMLGIYIFQGVYPFGNETLLTIDLGQQYVDFYAYYRRVFFEDPSSLFYSFSNSLGGEMTGIWAYYLTSPFNLLFLLFPHHLLSVAVTAITLLKISLSGLSFGILLKKAFDGNGFILSTFSICYALMGYTIVYQLNLMWLDGLIFLPMVILGVEKLIHEKKGLFYSLFLGLTLFVNYYIGYMICLFLVCYFLFRLIAVSYPSVFTVKDKMIASIRSVLRFICHSLLGAGLTGAILLPAFNFLLGSKASYTTLEFDWELAFPFHEMLSKLMIGSFNFDQMPSGYPTLFIGSLSLICFCLFFFNRAFPLRERISGLVLTVFLVVSMNLEAFNMIWHAMQYPIWFPYRFSFVLSFFMILNGYRSLTALKGIDTLRTIVSMVLTAVICAVVYAEGFDFVYLEQIIVTAAFTCIIILLLILKPRSYKWMALAFFVITVLEMGVNAQITLSRLSYIDQDRFTALQAELDESIQTIQEYDDGFYRIEKTFSRSKNDSFQANYYGVTNFSSTIESELPVLFGNLGFAAGKGFVTYSNGTLITDALFGINYYASEQNELYQTQEDSSEDTETENNDDFFDFRPMQTKPDLRSYRPVAETDQTVLYENPYALPVAFGSNEAILGVDLIEDQPIQMQETLLQAILQTPEQTTFFESAAFTSTVYQNVLTSGAERNQNYRKQDANEDASITFQFTPETDDAYYVTLSPNVKVDDVDLFLNNEPFAQHKTYRDMLVLNIANQQKGETISFKLEWSEGVVRLRDFQLYRLDQEAFTSAIDELAQGGMTIDEQGSTYLKGTVEIQEDQQVLLTTIPFNEGWQATVDGTPVNIQPALDSLMAIPMQPGTHEVEFTYHTPLLTEGVMLSIISALLLFVNELYIKNRHEK